MSGNTVTAFARFKPGDFTMGIGGPPGQPSRPAMVSEQSMPGVLQCAHAADGGEDTLRVSMGAQGEQPEWVGRKRIRRGMELAQINRIEQNFARRAGMAQKAFGGIPAERALINDVFCPRAQSPHGIVVSIRILAGPCGIGDSVLIPDEGNAELFAAIEKILGEGRRRAADEVKEIERLARSSRRRREDESA